MRRSFLLGVGDEAVKEIAAITEELEFLPPALASRWKLRPRLEQETLATLSWQIWQAIGKTRARGTAPGCCGRDHSAWHTR